MQDEATRITLDIASFTTLMGWAVGALPAIATILTIVWTGIRIYETETFGRWIGRKGPKPPSP